MLVPGLPDRLGVPKNYTLKVPDAIDITTRHRVHFRLPRNDAIDPNPVLINEEGSSSSTVLPTFSSISDTAVIGVGVANGNEVASPGTHTKIVPGPLCDGLSRVSMGCFAGRKAAMTRIGQCIRVLHRGNRLGLD